MQASGETQDCALELAASEREALCSCRSQNSLECKEGQQLDRSMNTASLLIKKCEDAIWSIKINLLLVHEVVSLGCPVFYSFYNITLVQQPL